MTVLRRAVCTAGDGDTSTLLRAGGQKLIAILGLLLSVAACANEAPSQAPGRGVRDNVPTPAPQAAPRRQVRRPLRPTASDNAPARLSAVEAAAEAKRREAGSRLAETVPHPPPTAATGEAAPAETDLARALRDVLGDPSACLAAGGSGSTRSTRDLTVHATIVASGRITRVEVDPSALPSATKTCVARRLEGRSLRVQGSIDAPPRTVTTSFHWEWQDAPTDPAADGTD